MSLGKSLIYSRKHAGPRMESRETPALTGYSGYSNKHKYATHFFYFV